MGFGDPIGMSAEHGEGLLDLFDLLSPFGELLNLTKKDDLERYEALMKEKEKSSQQTQPYDIRMNVDVVSELKPD